MEILFDVRYLCERYKINHWVNHILVGFGRIPTHFLSYAIATKLRVRAVPLFIEDGQRIFLSFFFCGVQASTVFILLFHIKLS